MSNIVAAKGIVHVPLRRRIVNSHGGPSSTTTIFEPLNDMGNLRVVFWRLSIFLLIPVMIDVGGFLSSH
jgi:hypothetical protein